MTETTIQIGKLFEILAAYEKLSFRPDVEQFINSDIKIKDQFDNWVPIIGAITKRDTGVKITFSNGDVIKCANNHKLIKDGKSIEVFAKDLRVSDGVTKANGEIILVLSSEPIDDDIFYDLSVNTSSHLYQTSNGIVHHNTELSKLLAENMNMKLLRYDMSEYQEKHTVAKLIGAPPGYVGYEDGNLGGGLLISDIEKNPNCVILFDEVEKAHPDVTNVLLSMMDEGFVTGSNGKKADARNALIIMTSNLGAAANDRNNIGFGQDLARSGEDDKAVKDFFKPEFRNRLDAVCKFNKLDQSAMRHIVAKFLNELNDLLSDKHIKVRVAESMVDHLLEVGFDPKMGARPLGRKINELIKVPLSKKILFDNVEAGSTVEISRVSGETVFNVIGSATTTSPVDQNGFIVA